jgi:hypothetical protein
MIFLAMPQYRMNAEAQVGRMGEEHADRLPPCRLSLTGLALVYRRLQGGSGMGILTRWREARGTQMREEYEDALARMRKANLSASSVFLDHVSRTIQELVALYKPASKSRRKTLLRLTRKNAATVWDNGDLPSAISLAVACLNAESRFIPGDDAAYVRLETERFIKEGDHPSL